MDIIRICFSIDYYADALSQGRYVFLYLHSLLNLIIYRLPCQRSFPLGWLARAAVVAAYLAFAFLNSFCIAGYFRARDGGWGWARSELLISHVCIRLTGYGPVKVFLELKTYPLRNYTLANNFIPFCSYYLNY